MRPTPENEEIRLWNWGYDEKSIRRDCCNSTISGCCSRDPKPWHLLKIKNGNDETIFYSVLKQKLRVFKLLVLRTLYMHVLIVELDYFNRCFTWKYHHSTFFANWPIRKLYDKALDSNKHLYVFEGILIEKECLYVY